MPDLPNGFDFSDPSQRNFFTSFYNRQLAEENAAEAEEKRRFDVSQQNRNALLEQLGLATPGGPAAGQTGFAEDSIFGSFLGDNGPSQGFTDLLADQRSSRDSLLSQAQGFGEGLRLQQAQDFSDARGSLQSEFEGRGLGASNLRASKDAAFTREQNIGKGLLEQQLLGQRLDLEQGLNQGIFSTQEGQLARDSQRQLQGISTIGQIGGSLI